MGNSGCKIQHEISTGSSTKFIKTLLLSEKTKRKHDLKAQTISVSYLLHSVEKRSKNENPPKFSTINILAKKAIDKKRLKCLEKEIFKGILYLG